jgi:outer membrane protein TolC
MAQANVRISVAQATTPPTITVGDLIGYESVSSDTLFSTPNLFWLVGSAFAETVDHGELREATVVPFAASDDASVPAHRQTVLVAF